MATLVDNIRVSALLLVHLLLFPAFLTLDGQNIDWDNYAPLRSKGPVPPELFQKASTKYQLTKDSLARSLASGDVQTKEEFLLQSTFAVDDFLGSGKVLFNDPISNYLNEIKSRILATDPSLDSKVKVYAVKSSAINAFATTDGSIFFNLGLLARLQNQAQVAFVLCHEIQHVIFKDPMEGYVFETVSHAEQSMKGKLKYEYALFERNVFSRFQEARADRNGIRLFLDAGYSLEDARQIYDVFQFEHLPLQEKPFDPAWISDMQCVLPAHVFTSVLTRIDSSVAFDPYHDTHPSLDERRAIVDSMIQTIGPFPQHVREADARFSALAGIANYEVLNIYLKERRFIEALYLSYILSEHNPDSYYLAKAKVWALYGIARYCNEGKSGMITLPDYRSEGEMSRLEFLVKSLKPEELTVLAIRSAWTLNRRFPEDIEVNKMLAGLLTDLQIHHQDFIDHLRLEPPPHDMVVKAHSAVLIRLAEPQVFTSRSAVDSMRGSEQAGFTALDSTSMFAYGLADLQAEPDFAELMRLARDSATSVGDGNTAPLTFSESWAEWRMNYLRGRRLGLQRVIFVNPGFVKVDRRARQPILYVESAEKSDQFKSWIRLAAEHAHLDAEVMDARQFQGNDMEKFNDAICLEDWLRQEAMNETVRLVNIHQQEAAAIQEKYKADAFCWTGAISILDKPDIAEVLLPVTYLLSCPPAMLVSVYKAATPSKSGLYFNYVVDVAGYGLIYSEAREINIKDSPGLWKSSLYGSIIQFKAKKRDR